MGHEVLRRHPARQADHAAEGRAGDADDEKRLVYEDRVQVPRLYVQWPTVGEKSDDQYALDVLGAILTGPRTARLTKALVYDQQAAAARLRASRARTRMSASSS